MGKKNAKEMHLMKEDFYNGLWNLGIQKKKKANQVFSDESLQAMDLTDPRYAYSATGFSS